MRACNKHKKKCEIGDIMHERDLDGMALSETRLKGRAEEKFGTFKDVKSEVYQGMYAREGVAIVMKDELWGAVKVIKEVNTRLMWWKIKKS